VAASVPASPSATLTSSGSRACRRGPSRTACAERRRRG
jgi:hypothetical protein